MLKKKQFDLTSLLQIMKTLRDPTKGCPWDQNQTIKSIVKYTIEEVYEVVEAIEKNDSNLLKIELGDLLFQIIFYCQISDEKNEFNFSDVVDGVSKKMIKRHPHVFSKPSKISLEEQKKVWEALKTEEKDQNKETNSTSSSIDGIPITLPSLMRSLKLQEKASRVGFDWPEISQVYNKVLEELNEIKMAETKANIEEEIGDLLFSVVNLARHLEADPETALLRANLKFEKRFRNLENEVLSKGKKISENSIAELEKIWAVIKNR